MVSLELFRPVAELLSTPVSQAEEMNGGMINSAYRLTMADGSRVIAKRYTDLAFENVGSSGVERGAIEDRVLRLLPKMLPETARRLVTAPEAFGLLEGNDGSVLGVQGYLTHTESLEGYFTGGNGAHRQKATGSDMSIGSCLGEWLAALHSVESPEARSIHNPGVQETRKAVQYDQAGFVLSELRERSSQRGELPEEDVRALMEETGSHFLVSALGLTMGDAWPRSFLIEPGGGLGVIDWEFSHFGSPVQDIAHLLAHLWMVGKAGGKDRFRRAERLAEALVVAYESGLSRLEGGDRFRFFASESPYLYLHGAAELIMRLGGAYAAGYLFAETPHETRLRAMAKVEELLLSGREALKHRSQEFSITPFFKIMFA